MRRLSLIATAAVALALAPASLASAAVYHDGDDPFLPDDRDLGAMSSSWFGKGSNLVITHTISTYAPYRRRPCLSVSAPGHSYRTCNGELFDSATGTSVPITVTESPADAPDTVTYRFTASQIGSPSSYDWRAWLPRDPTSTFHVDLPFITIDEDPFPPLDPPDWP